MSTEQQSSQHRPARARRVTRWTIHAAIVLVILLCAAWIVPALLGFSRYVVTGGSMTGTFDKGSVVFEKPVAVDDLRVGDVITYLPPADSGVSTLVTHRVVAMEPAVGGGVLFTTKGDANPQKDPWQFRLLDTEQPVVQFAVPRAGWVFIALANRSVRMLAIGLPAALIALGALSQLVAALRERRAGKTVPAEVTGVELVGAEVVGGPSSYRIPSQRSVPTGPDHELV